MKVGCRTYQGVVASAYIYYKKRVQIKNFREFLVLEGRESTPSTWLFSLSTILIRCNNFEEFWRFEHRNSVWNASSNSKRHSRNPPCFIPRVIHSKKLLFVHRPNWCVGEKNKSLKCHKDFTGNYMDVGDGSMDVWRQRST